MRLTKGVYCEKCKVQMSFHGFASMGGSHSNYYRCSVCGNIEEVYDHELEISEEMLKHYV